MQASSTVWVSVKTALEIIAREGLAQQGHIAEDGEDHDGATTDSHKSKHLD